MPLSLSSYFSLTISENCKSAVAYGLSTAFLSTVNNLISDTISDLFQTLFPILFAIYFCQETPALILSAVRAQSGPISENNNNNIIKKHFYVNLAVKVLCLNKL